MLIWSKEAFISALSLSLAHSLWQGALIGTAAGVLHSRLKRATADVRYAACGLLLLTLVIAWFCSFAYLYDAEARAADPPVAAVQFSALSTIPIAATSDPVSSDLPTRTLRSFAPSLVLLWTLGVSLLSIRHLSSLLALRRLRRVGTTPCPPEWQARIKSLADRIGLRREVLVLLSARVDVPLTFGVLKSYILLPPSALLGLSAEQLEALIAHELVHIRRYDALVNILQIYAETLLFYHPTVWRLSAQMRVAREQRCDDLAVRIVGDHALYARALLTMEELRAPIPYPALGAAGGNSHMSNNHLIQRIQRVLGAHGPEKRTPWMAGALALCTASISFATIWPVHAHSAPHPALVKRMGVQQTGTTNTNKGFPINIGTSMNGKTIGMTIYPKAPEMTPDALIKVDGQEKRLGDLSADDQHQIREIAALVLRNWRENWQIGLGTSVNGKSIGMTIAAKMPDLTLDSPIKVDGQQKRLGDLSADDQNQIRRIVADTRKDMDATPETPVAVNGQSKEKTDAAPVAPEITYSLKAVNGQSKKQTNVAAATSKVVSVSKDISSKRSSTATIADKQKVYQLKVGNSQVKVFGDTLKPNTIIIINGVKSRFKDLSANRQKQIRAEWYHSGQSGKRPLHYGVNRLLLKLLEARANENKLSHQ